MDEQNYTQKTRKKIQDFMVKNKKKPKFLIVGDNTLKEIQKEKDYIHEYMLAKRGKGDHFQGLMICTVEYGTNEIFEVA